MSEVPNAVLRVVKAKDEKGASYSTDILLLHTIPAPHKPQSPSIGFHTKEIVDCGTRLSTALKPQFEEVWFLLMYHDENHGLYRLG